MEGTADRLIALRKSFGLKTQDKLEEKISAGKSTIALWEQGKRLPSAEHLVELSELYGVTVDYILLGRDAVTYSDTDLPQDVLNQVVQDLEFIYQHDKEAFMRICKLIAGMRYEVILD